MSQDICLQDDAEAVRRVRSGDASGFAVLVDRYFGRVRAIAYARLGDHEAADDLAQEVFLLAWLQIGKLRDVTALPAWLGSITRHQAAHWIRNRMRRSRLLSLVPLEEAVMEIPDSGTPDAREQAARQEEHRRLQEAILDLPTDLREMVLLHYGEGVSQSELARQMGVTPSTVSRLMKQAVKLLRGTLEVDLRAAAKAPRSVVRAKQRALTVVLAAAALAPEARQALSAAAGDGVPVGAEAPVAAEAASGTGETGWTAGTGGTGRTVAGWGGIKAAAAVAVVAVGVGLALGGYSVVSRLSTFSGAAAVRSQAGSAARASAVGDHSTAGQVRSQRTPARAARRQAKAQDAAPATTPVGLDKLAVAPALGSDTSGTLVRGRVFRPDGSPASGAMVSVQSWKYTDRPTAVTTTDSSGTFEQKLPPGSYWFYAKLGPLVKLDHDTVTVQQNKPPSHDAVIRLEEGGSVRGQVIDTTTDKPVAGALVILDDGDYVKTDGDGRFLIEGVRNGSHSICAVRESFYRPVVYFDTTGRADAEVVLETKPGATVRGTVTDENGRPVAGATVHGGGSGARTIVGTMRATTDREGRYRISGYDPGKRVRSLTVEAPGYGQTSSGRDLPFPDGGNELELNIRLGKKSIAVESAPAGNNVKQLRTITGRVTDPEGRPVAGAVVTYETWDAVSARTDAEGHFRLEGVAFRNDLLLVQKEGFAPAFAESGTSETAVADFRLEPQHALRGKVVDEEGNPVAGVSVAVSVRIRLNGNTSHSPYLEKRTKTEADGGFELDSLPADKVLVDIYGGNYSEIRGLSLEVDRSDHVITLTAPGQISGTVVDAEISQPLTDFTAQVHFPRERRADDPETGSFSAAYSDQGLRFRRPDGTFTITGVNNKVVLRVEVSAPGYTVTAHDRVRTEPVSKINPGANIIRMSRARPLEGVVLGAGSTTEPLAGARVMLLNAEDTAHYGLPANISELPHLFRPITIQTATDGRFRFDSVPYAQPVLMVEKDGYLTATLMAPFKSEPLEVVLQQEAIVRGTVTGSPGIHLFLGQSGGSFNKFTTTDADGRYEFRNVPAGTYSLRWKSGHPLVEDTEIRAGQEYVFNSDGQTSAPAARDQYRIPGDQAPPPGSS